MLVWLVVLVRERRASDHDFHDQLTPSLADMLLCAACPSYVQYNAINLPVGTRTVDLLTAQNDGTLGLLRNLVLSSSSSTNNFIVASADICVGCAPSPPPPKPSPKPPPPKPSPRPPPRPPPPKRKQRKL